MNPLPDYDIHYSNPVQRAANLIHPFQLNLKSKLVTFSSYQYTQLVDNISWLQLGFYG